MRNLFRSENISLFRIALFLSLSYYFRNIWVLILSVLYFFLLNRKECMVFILLSAMIILSDNHRYDIIPIGIVEKKDSSYVTVDKFFYKVRLFTDNEPDYGDILLFYEKCERTDTQSLIRKNILFSKEAAFRKIADLKIRKIIRNRIGSLDSETGSFITRIIYNEYTDSENMVQLGYGLFAYYCFSRLRKRSVPVCLITLFLYSLCFCFENKFFLIFIDCICDLIKARKDTKTALRILLFLFLNPLLLTNKGILIPILLDLYSLFDSDLCFHTFLVLVFSFCFHEISLLNILFYEICIRYRIFLFLFSVLILLFPFPGSLFRRSADLFSFLFVGNIHLRVSVSVFSLLLFLLIRKRIQIKKTYIEMFLMIILLALPLKDLFFQVTFIDVGQGDAIMIHYPFSFTCVLIDTGSSYQYQKLKNELYSHHIYRISDLIITHDDEDHNGNLEKLKEDFIIERIIDEGCDFDYRNITLKYLKLGVYDNDNDNSLVYSLNVNGIDFLFTGDISKDAERDLIRMYGPLDIDVLKVSHHGSRSGSSRFFISSIMPEIAVISTSGNYNHPHQEVLDILNSYNVRILSTKQSGSVSVFITRFFSFVKTAHNEFVIMG